MMPPYPVDILVDRLKINWILLFGNLLRHFLLLLSLWLSLITIVVKIKDTISFLRSLWRSEYAFFCHYFMYEIWEHPIAIVMEKLLQQLVLIVIVIQFNHKRINLLYLMKHIQVLLSLNSVQYPLGILAQLWQLLGNDSMLTLASTSLSPAHHEVNHLCFCELEARCSETHLLVHHLLLSLPVSCWLISSFGLRVVPRNFKQSLIVEDAKGLTVHNKKCRRYLTWEVLLLCRLLLLLHLNCVLILLIYLIKSIWLQKALSTPMHNLRLILLLILVGKAATLTSCHHSILAQNLWHLLMILLRVLLKGRIWLSL